MTRVRRRWIASVCAALHLSTWFVASSAYSVCHYPVRTSHYVFGRELSGATFGRVAWAMIPTLTATALVPLACGIAAVRERVTRRTRSLIGRCSACGYDLRASKERCPECGLPIP
jgi:hypothetical protein